MMTTLPIKPATISGINQLPYEQKRNIYKDIIPQEIYDYFSLYPDLKDAEGNDLLQLKCNQGRTDSEISVYHQFGFPDPVLYGHITDTLNGQLHILLYVVNDPNAPRFNVDRLPDGRPTSFGVHFRNLDAEIAAMQAGLAPGQIRRGLRMLPTAIQKFEQFVKNLGHSIWFAEPLYYHNAVLFERYGMTYAKGRKLMERIQAGFQPGGDLCPLLDCSTPFRKPEAVTSIRLRSWAIHDGLLGEPFNGVTMYRYVGKHAGVSTCQDCDW